MIQKIYQAALTYLSIREYSRFDLQKKLLQKGYPLELIETVLDQLVVQNLQSDQRFVESYIRARKRRGYGIQRIQLELAQRGISTQFMVSYLEELQIDWQQHILDVWTKKFHGKRPTLLAEKAKQYRFLQYRGFTTEQIQWVWQRENE